MNLLLHLFWGIVLFEIGFYGSGVEAENKTLLCYFNHWAIGSPGIGRFDVNDIDPNLCTHMIYFHLYFDIERNEIIKDSHLFNNKKGHEKLTKLKAKNPQLKVLIDLKLEPYSWNDTQIELMDNSSYVDAIVGNVVAFLQQYKFDGITLEFTPSNGEKFAFMNLVKTIKNSFLPFGYFLALFGFPRENINNYGYDDVLNLSRNVDFLILTTNDFHTPDNQPNLADHPAPLYKRPWDRENYTVDFIISQWINEGFPPEKIILVISLNGRSWALSSNDSTPPASAKGPGPPAIYMKGNGLMSYFEICLAVAKKGWQMFQDPHKQMGPYAVSPDKENKIWVGYDDPAMATTKSEYILTKGLGGVAVDDISLDDFRNKCEGGHYPMLTAIRNTLFPVTQADIEDLHFRQKVAFIFSLIVSICSFITFIYMFYWLYRLEAVCKCNFIYSGSMPVYDDCTEWTCS